MNRAVRIIQGTNDRLGRWISLASLLMVLIGSGNAVARYCGKFFGIQLSSNLYLEMQWYLFSLLFLLGAARTLQRDAHVRVDVFYGRLSKRGKAWLDLLGTLFLMIPFCILIIWSSLPTVFQSWHSHEISPDPGGLPRYPIKTLVPVAFTLLLLQGVCMALTTVQSLRQSEPSSHDA